MGAGDDDGPRPRQIGGHLPEPGSGVGVGNRRVGRAVGNEQGRKCRSGHGLSPCHQDRPPRLFIKDAVLITQRSAYEDNLQPLRVRSRRNARMAQHHRVERQPVRRAARRLCRSEVGLVCMPRFRGCMRGGADCARARISPDGVRIRQAIACRLFAARTRAALSGGWHLPARAGPCVDDPGAPGA
jgi:hypothetical protein